MGHHNVNRRRFVTLSGVTLSFAIAGCNAPTDDQDEDAPDETGEDDTTADGNDSEDEEMDETDEEEETDEADGDEEADEDDIAEVIVGSDGEFVFEPGTEEPLSIASGTTVRFVWDSDTHNVVVQEQPEEADWDGHEGIENEGFEFEFTFEVAGDYEYVCEPHEAQGMIGTIVVEES